MYPFGIGAVEHLVRQAWFDVEHITRTVYHGLPAPRAILVADASLHRSRAAARRHIGELRVVVDPEFRGKGLGSALIRELIDVGRTLGLDRLFFELVERREHDAIKAAVGTGFEEVGSLQGRVRDIYGSLQNLVILELPLDQDDLSMEY